MTLKEKLKWNGAIKNRLDSMERTQQEIASGNAPKVTFYWYVGKAQGYAIECYVEGDAKKSKDAADRVLFAALEYFYGNWRRTLPTPDGKVGHEAWKPFCLWYEEVMQSLPWACALSNWEAVRRIAEYPPEDKLPEAAKAKGETAWGWALISFLRGEPRKRVEGFIAKAEADKAKRPKMLCPVLRALIENDAAGFEKTLLAYLAYYRKSEFKLDLDKLLALDGTTLYHLGRKQGFKVQLPENVVDHVIHLN
jgi:hypothetical protein